MRLLGILVLALLASCVTMNSPSVARLGDNTFVVTHPLRATLEYQGVQSHIVVPAGFMMDLSSAPKVANIFESKTDRSMGAALVHDYLYWDQRCSPDEADAIYKMLMDSSKVHWLVSWAFYTAVSWMGDDAYKKNAEARNSKEMRFLTPKFLDEIQELDLPKKAKFSDIQEIAKAANGAVFDIPANPELKKTCARALEIYRTRSA